MNMKRILIVIIFFTSLASFAQEKTKNILSVSYFGETVTHPGLRIGYDVPVGKWGKEKSNLIFVSPSFGFYSHKRYQTSYFLLPELAFNKQNKKGTNFYAGAGIGYQLSIVPNTYIVGSDELAHEITASNWYFLSNIFVATWVFMAMIPTPFAAHLAMAALTSSLWSCRKL